MIHDTGHTTSEHTSTILLSSRSNPAALKACAKLSESLLPTNGTFSLNDTKHLIEYIALDGEASANQEFWVASEARANDCTAVSTTGLKKVNCNKELPVFCSNSAPNRISNQTDMSKEWQVKVTSDNFTFTGYA